MFSDLDLCQFLDVGYSVIQPASVPIRIHDHLFEEATRLYESREEQEDPIEKLDLIADTLVGRMPELQDVLHCEELTDALTRVLGDRPFCYPHSFIHRSSDLDQGYHKDSPLPWGSRGGMRSHRPNWAMVFYYPQDTTVDMGATSVLPGTQYWNVDRENDGRAEGEDRLGVGYDPRSFRELSNRDVDDLLDNQVKSLDRAINPVSLEVPKGSLVLVHFDLFHRGTRSVSTKQRYLFKFWYVRTTEPNRTENRKTITFTPLDARRKEVVVECAEWLGLKIDDPEPVCVHDQAQEADRLARAYQQLSDSPKQLVTQCLSGVEADRRLATYALVSEPEIALAAAKELIESSSAADRESAAFLLGEVGNQDGDLETLISLLKEEQEFNVRLTSINALGRLVRRWVSNRTPISLGVVFETLLNALVTGQEKVTRSGLVQSSERQCVYIALLNVVSSSVGTDTKPVWAAGLLKEIASQATNERDRYAKNTAVEVIRYLKILSHQKIKAS